MGIFCEINLYKPPNGVFMGSAGTIVSGVIKYAVDEETVFNKIIISLKGMGTLHVVKKERNKKRRKYHNSEIYIDIDNIISKDKDIILPIGTYEIPFKFQIPRNVPPTLAYRKWRQYYNVKCNITYYVRIKFNRPGIMNFAKHFKKEITIISGISPRLATTPITYGGQKKLLQLFTRKPRMVNIKANILNSVLKPSDKIILVCEVMNDTNVIITAVETKLVEIYKFFTNEREIARHECDISETDSKSGAIQRGETREILVEINIPSDLKSAEFSKLFSKDYYVFITVYLPVPHRNYVLDVPIQIDNSFVENVPEASCSSYEHENPPSYWETMNEYITDKSACNGTGKSNFSEE